MGWYRGGGGFEVDEDSAISVYIEDRKVPFEIELVGHDDLPQRVIKVLLDISSTIENIVSSSSTTFKLKKVMIVDPKERVKLLDSIGFGLESGVNVHSSSTMA
ncbi:unnamed protein product [Dovyalis caffra]|uniref:Uncharacterized protein n=1 Tax=Dovyalis caffra TaxID=77055 RepID=A0AAV1RRB5_9ROSI|nr:unnamed protein product [Dovyalis caffra]